MKGAKPKDETGRRFGSLVVVSMHPPKKYASPRSTGGWRALCRCDCGELRLVETRWLRYKRKWTRHGARACLACTERDCKAASADTNRRHHSVKVEDGRTIGQIALATGLREDTVYHRHIRGWPAWRLGEVTQRRST